MICNTLTEAVIKLPKDIKKNLHTKKKKLHKWRGIKPCS